MLAECYGRQSRFPLTLTLSPDRISEILRGEGTKSDFFVRLGSPDLRTDWQLATDARIACAVDDLDRQRHVFRGEADRLEHDDLVADRATVGSAPDDLRE